MDLHEITDFHAPQLDVYARLTENQLVNRADPANALFIAESPLVIGRALDAGCVPVSFLMESRHVAGKASELLARCPADIPVYAAPLEVLEQLTGFKLTRGMLCAMRRPQLPTVEQVCANARRVAVLENVMNPTNIGAIFRSAAALNMDAVLLSTQGSDPLYRRAVRVSMGTVFQIPWTYFPDSAPWPEGGMALLASLLTGVLTQAVITEITVTGSLMLIGIGLNMLGLTKLRIMNMTPALLLPILLCRFM